MVWEALDAQGTAVWVPPDLSRAWEEHPRNQARISALADDGGRRYDAFWDWVDSHSPVGAATTSTANIPKRLLRRIFNNDEGALGSRATHPPLPLGAPGQRLTARRAGLSRCHPAAAAC
jgi:hypothetical protein